MVTIAKDVKYAFSGDTVTFKASSLSGDRARFKLTSKPYDSALKLYDDNEENYLTNITDDRSKFVPDVPGSYTFTCLDEDVSTNVKHFENDGGTGLSKGIVSATVVGSAGYTLHVGERIKYELGIDEHRTTMVVAINGDLSQTGVLTYYAGKEFVAQFSGATTDLMELANRSSGITTILNFYGLASGYTDDSAFIATNSFLPIITAQLNTLAQNYNNNHVDTLSAAVHDAVDTSNSMSAVSKPTTEAQLITYTTTLKSKASSHFQLATGAAHPKGSYGSITSVAVTDKNSALSQLRNCAAGITSHQIKHTTDGHYRPGDQSTATIMPWNYPNDNDSTSTIISYATSIASKFDAHLVVTSVKSNYHLATGGGKTDMMYSYTNSWDELKNAVNYNIEMLEAHASNRNPETGSSVSYHTQADINTVPLRASDRASTIKAFHCFHWAYLNHVIYGSGLWHGFATTQAQNPGSGYKTISGCIERLQCEILDVIKGNNTATPPNTLNVYNALISRGFEKA